MLGKKSMSLFRLHVINFSGSSCATKLKRQLGKFSCLMSSVQSLTSKSLKGLFLSPPFFYIHQIFVIGDLLARHHHWLRPQGETTMGFWDPQLLPKASLICAMVVNERSAPESHLGIKKKETLQEMKLTFRRII